MPTHCQRLGRSRRFRQLLLRRDSRRQNRIGAPRPGQEPVDDVNWFARPVPNESGDWIIAFASHSQNYLYNLSQGTRVKIPDRSDAVATPDGHYMTVPSNYTPDEHIRFYDARELLDHLDRGEDADGSLRFSFTTIPT